MQQINATDVEQSPIGNLFRHCGQNGDGTPLTAEFMNGLMMELVNVINKSCQMPIAFDKNNPASYNQLWQAIIKSGGTGCIPDWKSGNQNKIVRGVDCQLYLLKAGGDPTVNPVGNTQNWNGAFCSVAEMIGHLMKLIEEMAQPPDFCELFKPVATTAEPLVLGSDGVVDQDYRLVAVDKHGTCRPVRVLPLRVADWIDDNELQIREDPTGNMGVYKGNSALFPVFHVCSNGVNADPYVWLANGKQGNQPGSETAPFKDIWYALKQIKNNTNVVIQLCEGHMYDWPSDKKVTLKNVHVDIRPYGPNVDAAHEKLKDYPDCLVSTPSPIFYNWYELDTGINFTSNARDAVGNEEMLQATLDDSKLILNGLNISMVSSSSPSASEYRRSIFSMASGSLFRAHSCAFTSTEFNVVRLNNSKFEGIGVRSYTKNGDGYLINDAIPSNTVLHTPMDNGAQMGCDFHHSHLSTTELSVLDPVSPMNPVPPQTVTNLTD